MEQREERTRMSLLMISSRFCFVSAIDFQTGFAVEDEASLSFQRHAGDFGRWTATSTVRFFFDAHANVVGLEQDFGTWTWREVVHVESHGRLLCPAR